MPLVEKEKEKEKEQKEIQGMPNRSIEMVAVHIWGSPICSSRCTMGYRYRHIGISQ
jgi:hypothetical protein